MNFRNLLGDISPATFFGEYFHRLPFSLPGAARGVCELGTWTVLAGLLAPDDADVMVVRDGQRNEGAAPQNLDAARALSDDGYTILVRHAERHDARLRQLAAAFAQDFAADVDVHLYVTPPGKHGFGWHYDAEDVFILQTAGRKEYSLRKNTVHPWPLVETIPADMQYERELMPLVRVLLAAGDWLYIPCGWWHKAAGTRRPVLPRPGTRLIRVPGARGSAASDETAISLAVGVMSPAAIDIYDFLRGRLVDSLLWRQRLPPPAETTGKPPEEVESECRTIFGQLADDLSAVLRDATTVREFLARRPPPNAADDSC